MVTAKSVQIQVRQPDPRDRNHLPQANQVKSCYVDHMKVEDIAEAVARLPPDELARFRRWFSAFEAGRTDDADELDSTATKLGRFAGRALAELKKRTKDREP